MSESDQILSISPSDSLLTDKHYDVFFQLSIETDIAAAAIVVWSVSEGVDLLDHHPFEVAFHWIFLLLPCNLPPFSVH